jgi:uncharacterized protein
MTRTPSAAPWEGLDHGYEPALPATRSLGEPLESVVARRLGRREFLTRSAGVAVALALGPLALKSGTAKPSTLAGFQGLPHGLDEHLHVADGHRAQILLRWGDPLWPGMTEFDPLALSAEEQARRFGYNNDFVGYLPLDRNTADSRRGLLVVNHEYTCPWLMFAGSPASDQLSAEQLRVEQAAHGLSIVEVHREPQGWRVLRDSRWTRRITPATPVLFSGPAAGHPRMRTRHAPDGRSGLGTIGNCAGGLTPWGTMLSGEENVQDYFSGDPGQGAEAASRARFGISGKPRYHWGRIEQRWRLEQEPQEPNHFGWIVEVDPRNPEAAPVKRTALGRMRHEGCTVHVDARRQVVAYSGDDQAFEYLYRFVAARPWDPQVPPSEGRWLDDGVLSVARFEDDGSLRWLRLVFGEGPLRPEQGFHSQADVLIDVRRAADLLGATPLDRPEDVETHPVTGTVFVMLTKNAARRAGQTDAANPRAVNRGGHVLELIPPEGDHGSDLFRWEVFLLAGDEAVGGRYGAPAQDFSWLAAPDNCAFDNRGRLWIATDGAEDFGVADGAWVCEVAGEQRAVTRRFLRVPIGAELCGPCFTPDDGTFFCAVQHPGEESGYDAPATRWPDFDPALPPRPSVVAVFRPDGGPVA